MDCRTAQQLLPFDRAHAPELPPEDRAALGRHLAVCPACRALEQRERRFDEAVGKAMRSIDVPEAAARQVHAVLDEQYQEERRRHLQFYGRVLAAAAALLALLGGAMWWHWSFRSPLTIDGLHEHHVAALVAPPDAEDVEKFFADQGVTVLVPRDSVNYAYLCDKRMVDFQGQRVPMLLFRRTTEGRTQEAQLFIVSTRQFDLKALSGQLQSPSGYRQRVTTVHAPGGLWAYVYVHTGEKIDWLRPEPAVS